MEAGVSVGDDPAGQIAESRKVGHFAVAGGEAAEHPGHVPVKSGSGSAKGNAGDGAGGVVADAGKFSEGIGIGGKVPARQPDHRTSQGVEKAGSAVVSQAFPHPEDPGGGGTGQLGPPGEKFHPSLVVGDDRGNPGLLTHEFGHGGAVGGRPGAPGERAVMLLVPGV